MFFTARWGGGEAVWPLTRRKNGNKSHLCEAVFLFARMCGFGVARICCYKDSCLLTRKGRPVIRAIKSCDWSLNKTERWGRNRLDGPLLASIRDGMWVCVRKKWSWERELKRERDLFNRLGERIFCFQERDDRWKERLRRGQGKKSGKMRLKKLTSRGREGRMSRNERDQRQRPH